MSNRFLDTVVASAVQGRDVTEEYMWKNFRTRKEAESQKMRIIRKGRMYKTVVEGGHVILDYDSYYLYAEPSDYEAWKRACSYAEFSEHTWNYNDAPKYYLPFKLYNLTSEGEDRLIYEFKQPAPIPTGWDWWEMRVVNRDNSIYGERDYGDGSPAMFDGVHRMARLHCLSNTAMKWRDDLYPRNYVPCPYQLLHNGEVMVDYIPPDDIVVNPEHLTRSARGK